MSEVQELDRYQLSPDDFTALLTQCVAAATTLRHDARGPLGVINGYAGLIVNLTNRVATATGQSADLTEIARCAERVGAQATRLDEYLTRAQPSSRVGFSLRPFVTDVAGAVAAAEDGNIVVDADAQKGLRVLFPSTTLYVMLHELAQNGLRHGGGHAAIGWSIDADHLVLSVHDIGTELRDSLGDTLRVLSIPDGREGGLSLVNGMVWAFNGMLLGRRSPLTSGAEIAVRLPLTAFSFEARA